MNNASRSDDQALSASAAERVDEVCDRFEQAWKAGQRPRIEAYLADALAADSNALLRELVALELAYRHRAGESPSLEEYHQRFPEHVELIAREFGKAAVSIELDADQADSSGSSASTGREPVVTRQPDQPLRLGRYRVTGTLGKGTFGVVYQGYDEDLQRVVAIKVPHREQVSEMGDIEAYLREARVLASLDHPHIVPVHDFGHTDDGLCYVVSKFIEGSDLKARLREARLSVTESAELMATVAEALHHAHRRRLVHRDIKPSNILIDTAGKAYVVDFGLASKEEDFGRGLSFAGTPAYMSPEQARGEGHRLDARSDIFSLGVVFYELLTGQHPFMSRSRIKLLEQITTVDPMPPRQVDDTLPGELERICLKALAKRASDRYTTAQDMAQDLRRWQAQAKSQPSYPVAVSNQPPLNLQAVPPSAVTTPGPGTPSSTPSSFPHAVQIIPKGLRSFDASDADFFLELLPGPRDREGLPDSIRFWKSKIEERDPDKTFAVGLFYGPSGCGKSSLVKAGLLPRLAGHVLAVYLEATPLDTESRLLRGLHKQCPQLARDLGLTEAIAALRRGRGLPEGKKVLIVLDQVEQWLHAHGVQEQTELVQALRQCDGERVQCIVMVRDDFGMAATRLMAALDIPILQGHNFATMDLFDPPHARKILAAYGRAFGRLPESPRSFTREQKAFLDQAVTGLAREGQVISIQLALFAEVVKRKDWVGSTLKAVGGMDGVGVTFLEETFASPYAPPQHRMHQKAARAVLKALLPETGSDIKGQMQSQQKLLEVSGYGDRPKDFETLLRILDTELRLITPTDPAGDGETARQEDKENGRQGDKEPRYYQLTHDYLIPSLREWLTRKQKETRWGRAQLRLAERAASWSQKAENRHLPSWWEWADIRLLTRKQDWTASQQKMMRRASRFHAERALTLVFFLVLLSWGLYEAFCWIQAERLVEALISAETTEVPRLVKQLSPYRGWAETRLLRHAKGPPDDSREHLHANLALVPVSDAPVEPLYRRLLIAGPTELPVIRDALLPYKDRLVQRLWEVVEHPEKGKEAQRLRAAAALAAYDPDGRRWDQIREQVAVDLVGVPAVYQATWKKSLRPVDSTLVPPLESIFRNRQRREKDRSVATEILVDYVGQQPAVLADLLMEADDTQFPVLYEKLKEYGDQGTNILQAELDREARPVWKDPNRDPSWKEPDPALLQIIEAAHGLWNQWFALCQTMPLKDFLIVVERLRQCGYRPIRFRPYATDPDVLVAAVWTRDGKDWHLAHGLSTEDVYNRDAEWHAKSFHPVDVISYVKNGTQQYAVLWAEVPPEKPPTKMKVGLGPEQVAAEDTRLRNEGYWRATTTLFVTRDRREQYSAIWVPAAGQVPPFESMHMENRYGENHLADLQIDAHIGRAAPPRSTKERCAEQLALAEKALQANPADDGARFQRVCARVDLGENEKANEDLSMLIKKYNGNWSLLYFYSAIIQARLGKTREAKDDLAKFEELHRDFGRKSYLEAVVSALLGDEVEGMKRLEAAIDSNAEQARFLYQAACAYALACGACAGKDAKNAKRFADRAVELLEKAVDGGFCSPELLDSDLDPLRGHPGFARLLQAGKLERNYIAIWHPRGDLESTQVHGHDPITHLSRCKKLVAAGFRPVSISAAEIRAKQPLATASVWHRPWIPDEEKEWLAKRQVNAAVALLKMGRPEKVWPLLKHKADPRVRSYLTHRLSSLAGDPQAIIERLKEENDVSTRRALLLCLGEFGEKELPPIERTALLQKLLEWYRNDPDSGIHGSVGWLLRQWGQMEKLQQMDKELASGKVEGERRWYTNGQGQTFAIVRGTDFLMGSPRTEAGREDPEQDRREPLHRRRIGRTFAIATHEVTVEQFLRLVPNHQYSKQYAPTTNCPVNGIAWYDAAAYCNLLSQKEGLPETEWCYEKSTAGMAPAPDGLKRNGYRLPTEAEWEFACRAESSTSRYYGETEELLEKYAWCTKNSETCSMPVGSLKPNDWGLFDMLGNNGEWTHDLRYDYYCSVPIFGRGATLCDDQEHSEPEPQRILRGGSFSSAPFGVRSATRFNSPPMSRGHAIGLRLARTLH